MLILLITVGTLTGSVVFWHLVEYYCVLSSEGTF